MRELQEALTVIHSPTPKGRPKTLRVGVPLTPPKYASIKGALRRVISDLLGPISRKPMAHGQSRRFWRV